MKLAEALIQRADASRRIQALSQRLFRSAKVQEGDAPPEDPAALRAELDRTLAEFNGLVKRINRSNITLRLADGRSMTEALADRDTLVHKQGILRALAEQASATQQRLTRSEVRFVPTVDVSALQSEVDELGRQARTLDTEIQALNWTADLVE